MNLHCEEHSNLSKHNTLFIHGNLASTKWWTPTLKAWRELGSLGSGSLFFADWRGCGQNEDWSAEKSFTIDDLAADFLNLIEVKRMGPVALVGHSLGGLIALKMMIMQPKIFTSAVLLDPVGAQGIVFDDSMYEAFRQMALSRDLTKMVILSTILGADTLPEDYKEQLADDAFKAVKGIGTSVLEILKSIDIREDVKQVQVPTTILHGDQDAVLKLEDSLALSKLLPQSHFEKITNAGHCWNVEAPKAWTQRLRQLV